MAAEGLDYWLRWQVPVCAVIMAVPSAAAVALIRRNRSVPINGADLWMPCWRYLNPLWLLIYRLIAFLSMALILYQVVDSRGLFAFYFYTQWTFLLVIVYFAIGTVISARGCWTYLKHNFENVERDQLLGADTEKSKSLNTVFTNKMNSLFKPHIHHKREVLEQTAGFWEYLMQIVYQTSAGAVLLTDIVFWCLLVPFMTDKNFKMSLQLRGCLHSLNAVFLLIDTSLNCILFPWFRLAHFILWSTIYIVFQWILHAYGFLWWPYPFLELASPWAPFWYFSLALVHILCYGFYVLIVYIKNQTFSKLFPHSYSASY